ncbi:3'-5' exonuclease [Anaerotignum sp. MB30-C6]|uniref:3'-5' exonuclease n=1 Tax=Anaerotignum sp. MB30-C6 TaxID=3070814 RepID=UPI0027DDEE43|nr:3'-5' exonuclease [Anaerotignum sp. MB30-C6]WMI80173.1 3'-5' exonuclease [Anaerotignum sp. MB30-C6]
MSYIVLDLEFNQSFPFKTGETVAPVAECPFEIIQIGAVKLNKSFQQIDEFNAMIQPQIYPRLHPFVEKITGLTEDKLKDQQKFTDAFRKFITFIGDEDAILCTWGADDIKSLFRNILYYKLDTNSITNKYLNVQNFATAYLNYEAGKAIGLKNAVTELNIKAESPFHDALNDAIYTAKVFEIVHPKEITATVFKPNSLLVTIPKPPRTNTPALLRHIAELMERDLTTEEKKMVKLAYFLGRGHTFDASGQEKKKKKSKN